MDMHGLALLAGSFGKLNVGQAECGRAVDYLRVGADVEAVVEQDVFRDHVDVLYDGLALGRGYGVARQLRDARRGGVVAGCAESLLSSSNYAHQI